VSELLHEHGGVENMTEQLSLFASREAQKAGIAQVSSRHGNWLEAVREFAIDWIDLYGQVTANTLRERWDLPDGAHPNLWGAVFKDRRFKRIGTTESRVVGRHASMIAVWGRR
jgi:hypothetical protein